VGRGERRKQGRPFLVPTRCSQPRCAVCELGQTANRIRVRTPEAHSTCRCHYIHNPGTGAPRFHRDGSDDLADQLAGVFIKTDDGTERIVRFFVESQEVFHPPQIIARHIADTPPLDCP
jgi:hypothetical protein